MKKIKKIIIYHLNSNFNCQVLKYSLGLLSHHDVEMCFDKKKHHKEAYCVHKAYHIPLVKNRSINWYSHIIKIYVSVFKLVYANSYPINT